MSDFEFTNDLCAYKVFVPTQVELATIEVYPACNDMYVLTGRIVMYNIATEVSITEPNLLHIVLSYTGPFFRR
ncbi:hypothetical protein KAM621c_11740 [Citrobacter braakii]|uniref:Uncharacterized protein n=1 Tax=Citrobacter braakii TaxID=57706 RepID=A0AAD1P141_CITBR|nr:hypothetical protein KAM621c_11740 [Citrobacter braakii]